MTVYMLWYGLNLKLISRRLGVYKLQKQLAVWNLLAQIDANNTNIMQTHCHGHKVMHDKKCVRDIIYGNANY